MLDDVDRFLAEWLAEATGGAQIEIAPPSASSSHAVLSLHLLDLLPSEPTSGPRRHPLQLSLRYLVSAHAAQASEAHALLGRAAFAALEHPQIQPEFKVIDSDLWRAFGVAPQPGFFLRVPVGLVEPVSEAPPVRFPAEIRVGGIRALRGRVVGPARERLARATVTLPDLNLVTETDENGEFSFPGIPSEPSVRRLGVAARGRQSETEVSLSADPLIVGFTPGAQ
jgi:hypothetical protein